MIRVFRTTILFSLSLLCSYSGYSQITSYLDFEPTAFEGSTVVENVYSPSLEGNLQGNPSTQPVKVYLPPGYSDFHDNRYPVVYILHGWSEDYNSFYYEYDLLNRLNRLISEKILVPMIIVTPNADSEYWGSWYTNSYVTGNWEDYIIHDVIQNIESKYRFLDQLNYRGLAGYSMGAHGAIRIAMRYPSLFNSICLMGSGLMDLETALLFDDVVNKEAMIRAAGKSSFSSAFWDEKACLSIAVAVAPDSTAKPVMGRFPFDADGVLIDSIWQKWLEHDPYTLLPTYRDSLLKLKAIQAYIGDTDAGLTDNDSFHLALQDYGIPHGYEIFQGGHNPLPIIDDVLFFFSEQLRGVVPMVRSLSDYYLENTDTLKTTLDMDGELYVVRFSSDNGLDSIIKYQIATADALANEENEIQLSELGYGKYQVYAISQDSVVSNIPAEFVVVPDKSHPQLNPVSTSITQEDSIRVTMSRDGKICLVAPNIFFPDTLRTASEIMNSSDLIESADALADSDVSFSADDLSARTYWIYGFDKYGIVSGPVAVEVTPVGIHAKNTPEISLYPIPTNHILTIGTDQLGPHSIKITSLNGQLIHIEEMKGTTHQIDLSSFQKGVYFITFRSKDFVTTRKIIKL